MGAGEVAKQQNEDEKRKGGDASKGDVLGTTPRQQRGSPPGRPALLPLPRAPVR